jgi:hypothetical protein
VLTEVVLGVDTVTRGEVAMVLTEEVAEGGIMAVVVAEAVSEVAILVGTNRSFPHLFG